MTVVVPVHTSLPAEDFCSRYNFWMTFRIFSFLAGVITLTFNFQGQIWNFIYISVNNGPIAEKNKANISLEI